MDITKENVDKLNAVLKVRIDQNDYEERVEKVLKEYRKTAKMPGFRPGKVPPGLIRKLYRTTVLVDEINKLVSESITKYLIDEKINILGEPLPSEDNVKDIDWENQTDFEFEFDLGLSPEMEINLSKRDKVPLYKIQVDNTMIHNMKEDYARRFGTVKQVEVSEGNEIMKGNFVQIDQEGIPVENGITAEDSSFSLEIIKDSKILETCKARKVGDTITFDVKKAFPNDTELASMLKIEKEKVPAIAPMFQFTIKEISRFEKAELNQDLYDQIYGKDQVKSDEEFSKKISHELEHSLSHDADYRFKLDARDVLLKKTKFDLPVDFLKRWLVEVNKEKLTKEKIDAEFPAFEDDLKWQLIRDKIIRDNEIKVEEDEVKEQAKKVARMQFRQYGMNEVPEEYLTRYADDMLKNEEEKKKVFDRIYEDKVFDHIKENVKIDEKQITLDKFNKLFEK